jgi:prepilin-type N-terminal cleavage/methylation domain-containing protein
MMIRKKQQGLTLVELMVGLVVGLIVIGGSLAMFLSTLQSSNHTLKMSKLNQDLTAVMQLMVNEVRRAGHTSDGNLTPSLPLVFDLLPYLVVVVFLSVPLQFVFVDPLRCFEYSGLN